MKERRKAGGKEMKSMMFNGCSFHFFFSILALSMISLDLLAMQFVLFCLFVCLFVSEPFY